MISTRTKESPRRTLAEPAAWARPSERLGREHYRGYGVMALPFDSGHVLALRVMPWNDFEPFEAVWHRTPEGRWRMYVQAEEPDRLCPRLFGPALSGWRPADIDVSWPDERTLHVRMERPDLDWTVRLRSSALTRLANGLLPRIPPETYRRRWCTSMVGLMAKHALGLGPLDLRGVLPGGQDVLIQPSRLYLVGASRATLMGRDLGAPVRADTNPMTGSFRWPALGVVARGDIHVGIGDRKEGGSVAGKLEADGG